MGLRLAKKSFHCENGRNNSISKLSIIIILKFFIIPLPLCYTPKVWVLSLALLSSSSNFFGNHQLKLFSINTMATIVYLHGSFGYRHVQIVQHLIWVPFLAVGFEGVSHRHGGLHFIRLPLSRSAIVICGHLWIWRTEIKQKYKTNLNLNLNLGLLNF